MGFFEWLSRPNVKRLEENNDVEGLIRALGYEKNSVVRIQAAQALGKIGDPRAVDPLIAALKDYSLCDTVAEALGEIGDPRAVVPLIEACASRVYRVPGRTELALMKFWDNPRARGRLIHLKIIRSQLKDGMILRTDGSVTMIG
jgi:hypothetical protein